MRQFARCGFSALGQDFAPISTQVASFSFSAELRSKILLHDMYLDYFFSQHNLIELVELSGKITIPGGSQPFQNFWPPPDVNWRNQPVMSFQFSKMLLQNYIGLTLDSGIDVSFTIDFTIRNHNSFTQTVFFAGFFSYVFDYIEI